MLVKSRIIRRKRGPVSSSNHCNMRAELGMVIRLVDMDILNTAPLDLGHVEARRRQRKAEVREEIDGLALHNRRHNISIKLVQVVH